MLVVHSFQQGHCLFICRFGSEKLKKEYLAPSISGDVVACLGVSEPTAGSDVASKFTSKLIILLLKGDVNLDLEYSGTISIVYYSKNTCLNDILLCLCRHPDQGREERR